MPTWRMLVSKPPLKKRNYNMLCPTRERNGGTFGRSRLSWHIIDSNLPCLYYFAASSGARWVWFWKIFVSRNVSLQKHPLKRKQNLSNHGNNFTPFFYCSTYSTTIWHYFHLKTDFLISKFFKWHLLPVRFVHH